MGEILITKHKPSIQEIQFFVSEIKSTQNITGYSFTEWGNFQDAWLSTISGELSATVVNG